MKLTIVKTTLVTFALLTAGAASADVGVGLKAGTLGLGAEARWSPLPWFDIRGGVNSYDYDDNGYQAGIDYDATFALDTLYVTGNILFPLSPFRLTFGAFENGNEFLMASRDTEGDDLDIGGIPFSPDDIGTLQGVAAFDDTAPYLGVGYDIEVLGKVGLNFDFGVLWQGAPTVALEASGIANAPLDVQTELEQALATERAELEDELNDFKAWPVVSLTFVYNF